MAKKMKVFEMKNLINEKTQGNIQSKDIQRFLEKNMGIKKTHSSNLDEHEIKAVKEYFIPSANKTSGTPATNKGRTASNKSEMVQSKGRTPQGGVPRGQAARGNQGYPRGAERPAVQDVPRQEGTGQGRPQGDVPRGRPPAGVAKGQASRSQMPSGGEQRPTGQGMPSQSRSQAGVARGQAPRSQMPSGGEQRPTGQGVPSQSRPQAGVARGQSPRSQMPSGGEQRPTGQGVPSQSRPQAGVARGQAPRSQMLSGGGQGHPRGDRRPTGQARPQAGAARGQRPTQGTGHYQSQSGRPQPQGGRYNRSEQQQQSQRSSANRQQRGYHTANRPQANMGTRPYNQGSQRPVGNQVGGQRGGYNRGYNKDENNRPAYGNRTQFNRRGAQSQRVNERKNFDQQILDQKVAEKNDFNNRRNRDKMNRDKFYKDKNNMQHGKNNNSMEKVTPKKGQFIKPKPVIEEKEEIKVITLPEVLTIKELANKMKIPSSALIKKLFLEGKVVTINQEITYEEAEDIAIEYDIIAEKEIIVNEVEELLKEEEEDPKDMVKRPPVVCVMGHVDHGKTSLLDAIRHADVTSREAGGITQHIGAYMVEIEGEKITFLDTPGHEAFTSMRMRGAKATDIAILVVAADDGVMPQTVEAISHAKAAGVQIIVAINKIDKPSANVERVKQELTEHELIAEDWGGDTIFVPVSAHSKEGIPQLLEMILLTAEIEELKANPDRTARGIVIEAELDKGRGSVATILVQKGSLRIGDNIAVGSSYGKVRAMIDDKGRRIEEATPSTPVEILGLNSVPDVGEIFVVTENEKEARTIAEAYITQSKEKLIADTKAKLSLDGLFSQIQAGNIKELNLIIKADVQGSVEAMKQSLIKLSNDEVAVRVIHGGVGAINESDVILASTSNGIIIGFNVKPDNRAKEIADYEKVDIKLYSVIYNAINDVEAAMKGLLDPVYEEKVIGHAEVRQTFKASGLGTIAGSYVLDGKITRGCKARIYRGKELIHEGNLASLKRFQDDVREVAAGYECGLVFDKFNDIKKEDKVELYVMEEVPR